MKAEPASPRLPIAKIAIKGSCPVCAAVKHCQELLLGNLRAEEPARLCNFHAWSVAKSAPAELAASLFLSALLATERNASPPLSCVACRKIHEEEVIRLKELVGELERSTIHGWFQQHARLCLRHILELKKRVPEPLQKTIEELGAKSAAELQEELQEFLRQARQGVHSGGGVLGRAAEFLVAQRGIID